MKQLIIAASMLMLWGHLAAQNIFKFSVRDSITQEALPGVTVQMTGSTNGSITGTDGAGSIDNISDGPHTVTFSFVGYKSKVLTQSFPLLDSNTVQVGLVSDGNELEAVTVSSMRTNSRIEDLPQKVEVLGEADLLEESTIKPGNISSILGDISVIHIQQTSATNGNMAVRMQGLDGKYTQILRDGIPAFDGLSGSFDVMSIPPLDLKQVEIIKGAASTLYGGGAIAGLINVISKTPTDSNTLTFTANYSTLREANVNGFFSGIKGRMGFTLFAGVTNQQASDIDKDGFSDVPKLSSYTVHPRLFIDIAKGVRINMGYTGTYELRSGGDMVVLKFKPDSLHQYVEENKIQRHTADVQLSADINEHHGISVKGAVNIFDRNVNQSGTIFHGQQITTYTEASYKWQTKKNTLVTGFNYLNDDFRKLTSDAVMFNNYNYSTYGLFAQDNWQVHAKVMIEAGMRVDYHSRYRAFALPRMALLFKPVKSVSVRVSSGTGYKTPGLFAAKDFTGRFNQLMAVGDGVKAEYAVGANTDINYHTLLFDELSLEVNQAFYYTDIFRPLSLDTAVNGNYYWSNGNYNVHSWGSDTYIRLGYKNIEVYVGYNHTVSKELNAVINNTILFAPQDKLSTTVIYEIPNKWRFGIEGSLIASQYIAEGTKARNYYLLAAMVERKIGKHWSLILNGENLLNVKQSSYHTIATGTHLNPVFSQLYAPIDGWLLNLCVQLRI